MRRQRLVLAFLIAAVVPASVLLTPSRSVADDEIDDEILEAYMADPDVAAEIEHFRERGYEDAGVGGVVIGGECGVAGCGYSVLIAHRFASTGSNPQTRSILARVVVDPFGEIARVERIELKPKTGGTAVAQPTRAPSQAGLKARPIDPVKHPELRIIKRIPAPSSEISAEPREANP